MTITKSWVYASNLVLNILMGKAMQKGYAGDLKEDGRVLLDAVKKTFPGHAEGEIHYKLVRWTAKRDPEDLLKIMAWAFLLWDQHNRNYAAKEEAINSFQKQRDWAEDKQPEPKMAPTRGVGGLKQETIPVEGYADFPQAGVGGLKQTAGEAAWDPISEALGRLNSISYCLASIENDVSALVDTLKSGGFGG